MTGLKQLIRKVEQWAEDRNFFDPIDGVTYQRQSYKLYEEFGELCGSIVKNKDVKDDIGDNLVVLINIARVQGFSLADIMPDRIKRNTKGLSADYHLDNIMRFLYPSIVSWGHPTQFIEAVKELSWIADAKGTSIEECLQIAYDEIKNRKGRMIDGSFIKVEDLK